MNRNPDKTILLLDDDRSFCTLLEMDIERDGYEVVSSHTGPDALSLLRTNSYISFDLMILDLILPGTSGFTILQELQKPIYQKMPILILTARVLDKGTVDIICSQPLVRGLLAKPVDIHELRNQIHSLIDTVQAA